MITKPQNAKNGGDENDIMQELRKGRVHQTEDGGSSLWLITFTDIMALMLTFFVLLYSMSVPIEEDWEHVTEGITSQFSQTYSEQWNRGAQETINIDKLDFAEALDLGYLETIITNSMATDQRMQDIVLIPQTDHLIVSVPTDLLFEPGKADVGDGGKQVLFTLGNTMNRIRNRIEIIGHADPRPMPKDSKDFPSNWELSLARAGSVAAVLKNSGYQRNMTVRGLSSARYDELPDLPEDERLSLSRRVDIVIMEDDGSQRDVIEFDLP